MVKRRLLMNLFGASLAALSTGAFAQTPVQTPSAAGSGADSDVGGDIVVTARRREETAQDVPISINAVTGNEVAKLNLRQFEDIQTVVPGLQLANSANGTAGTASLRGIAFDPNASGANPSVEFYFNDGPISSNVLFTALFDVGQVEVLRGPQGTLRGRASPSGSITVTSKQADLHEAGGYVNFTGNNIGSINANAAVGVPIIKDVLAVRIAGVVDQNQADRVHSINNGQEPYRNTTGVRASFRFDPTDNISILGDYQRIERHSRTFDQVESTGFTPTSPFATNVPINGSDRLGVTDLARYGRQLFQTYNLQASWAFAGQRLNYVGALTKQQIFSREPSDYGDFFGTAYGPSLQTLSRDTNTHVNNQAHEIRLSSEERVFGIFDYIVGGFYNRAKSPTNFIIQTPVELAAVTAPNPALPSFINRSYVARGNRTLEKSVFGNLTAHINDKIEIAGGARYIDYKTNSNLLTGPTPTNLTEIAAARDDKKYHHVIYSAQAKYQFTPDLMAYASVGSSFRAGRAIVGDFSLVQSPREVGFNNLPPEKSTSYELGFKSSFLDRRVKLNVSGFHQTFSGYPYRATSPEFYISTDFNASTGTNIQSVKAFNFVSAVPVRVDGVEAEASFQVTRQFSIGGSLAYSHSKIRKGAIPCNDYFQVDGQPDSTTSVPTVAQIRAATGGDVIGVCNVSYNPSLAPPLSGVIQAEFTQPINDRMDGYVRTLATLNGKSKVDPSFTGDDVKKYGLINVYLGLRDSHSAWEVSLFAKNITNVGLVLTRTSTPITTSYASLLGGQAGVSNYYGGSAQSGITYTPPREFGLNLRYAFGSR